MHAFIICRGNSFSISGVYSGVFVKKKSIRDSAMSFVK